MPNPLYRTSVTGVRAQQLALDITANNLANVSTTGYKRVRADFRDLFYQRLQTGRVSDPAALDRPTLYGGGVRFDAQTRSFAEGAYEETGRALDVAIAGDGFFQLRLADGQLAYSRAGDLQVDANGRLMTPSGQLIEPAITLPNDLEALHVAENGTIYGLRAGAESATPLGQLQLARFVNPGGLRPIGDNLFVVAENSGPPQLGQPGQNGLGELVGGVLEGSNVDLSAEMTQMIQAQRAYQVNLKALQTIDEMTGQALQLRR